MAFKLFVSYSNKDRTRIEPLLFNIRNIPEKSNGLLDIFFYEESKTLCIRATEDVVEKIRTSDAVLYFHSNNSILSEFVQNEIGGAVAMDKQVIIANLDMTPVKGMLQGINYLNFANPDVFNREINSLLTMIKSKIEDSQKTVDRVMLTSSEINYATDQGQTNSSSVSKKTSTSIKPAYTIEDWKMILVIVGVISLAYIALRSSKQA